MNWSQLLSRKRLGTSAAPSPGGSRTDFQRDFDRIVFSSAFRRMQDKTQVFPLSQSDYVRTRLTHSLEASCVGRTLGTLAGETVIRRHRLEEVDASDFGAICAAACLAHDIGNPPFGHSGEDGIRHWAETAAYGRSRVHALRYSEREDFLHFEGNAQGFRILTRLQSPDNPGGLQLTCATLAAFTKYPRESWLGGSRPGGIGAKKQGFFAEDHGLFEEVADEVGLIRRNPMNAYWCRHPLAFLVEAADDICYRVIDIEDGFRLGHLGYDEVTELFCPLLKDTPDIKRRLAGIEGRKAKVEFLRAKVINEAVNQVRELFLDEEEALLAGRYDDELLAGIPLAREMQALIEVAMEKVYCAPEVVEIETAGFQVITELMERFVQVVDEIADKGAAASAKSRMTVRLIPAQFLGPGGRPAADPYTRLLRITDFISGMTDSYAVSLYKKVTGISLPGG